jgi:hypothetical protein
MVLQPNYTQRPFFSLSFRSSIAVGSYFVFNVGSCGKRRVGRIIAVTKADNDDHEVKVNIFIPFNEWKLRHKHFSIGEGLAKGVQEVVLTTEISEFLFDRDVEDVAFVFTPGQLEEYGAILQGIDNAFVCRFDKEGGNKLTKHFLQPSLRNMTMLYAQSHSATHPRSFMTLNHYAIESTRI